MLLQFIMGLLAFKSLAQNWKKVELGDQIRRKGDFAICCFVFRNRLFFNSFQKSFSSRNQTSRDS